MQQLPFFLFTVFSVSKSPEYYVFHRFFNEYH